ncbi:type II secretion system protein [Oculatella sp. LEGE 06141]|uniref:prepilin-type N-terminal cleavage/methylation domain-containing protein n=1 Tax=Oculatella sp. LEGE 06141 TaxID=1828648 RepID=UPI001880ECB2|nr:prepilin-type N-terminal cleavage/methylation domain-containing protein [Oculatella sp. LEGE 06141]MBE9177730.1 type II secretion system protein [Oculatella sp. LEGE 06141]
MVKTSLLSRMRRFRYAFSQQRTKGFTLLELLVVMLIAGGIVSGLMYVVVELTTTDQRESSLTETQREMQLALDYIGAELREATYIYTGECLAGQTEDLSKNPPIPYCPGLADYIPATLKTDRSVPIIAFWKQQPIPSAVRDKCAKNTEAVGTPCQAASSYSLVVYSLALNQPTDIWKGRARITRYALTQFNSKGDAVAGYANPASLGSFDKWPLDKNDVKPSARPTGDPVTLVDFVDDGSGAVITSTNFSTCPTGYSMSPPNSMLTGKFSGVRSVYACVNIGLSAGENRDVLLFVRGNAYGRAGVRSDAGFLPTLQTQVLSRGVLGKNPGATTN